MLSNAKYAVDMKQVKVRSNSYIKTITINSFIENNQVVIEIVDNGVGIPKRQQKNVFEKFFRSDNVSRYQVSGTGLGLYIAKNIVEQSGGGIWFKSKEGKGSTFYFSLPVKLEDR